MFDNFVLITMSMSDSNDENSTHYTAHLSHKHTQIMFSSLSAFQLSLSLSKRNNLIMSECLNSLLDLILCIWPALLNAREAETHRQTVIDRKSPCSFSGESIACLSGKFESY